MATQKQKDKAWDNAKKVRGKNSEEYRQDPYGNTIYKSSYGKSSEMGWDVDHIKPKSKGGSDSTKNLQALNASVNRSKGNTLQKKSRHSKNNK
ncbi:MAG: HNH endonuclease signature motif containing protein [Woeseiaceae bacterium]